MCFIQILRLGDYPWIRNFNGDNTSPLRPVPETSRPTKFIRAVGGACQSALFHQEALESTELITRPRATNHFPHI